KLSQLQGYILQNHSLSASGWSTFKLTKEILGAHYIHPNETGKIAGIRGNIEGIKVWVMCIEEMDIMRVRLRSKGVVINTMAEKYSGGGHPHAAGASVLSWEEAAHVINDIEQLL